MTGNRRNSKEPEWWWAIGRRLFNYRLFNHRIFARRSTIGTMAQALVLIGLVVGLHSYYAYNERQRILDRGAEELSFVSTLLAKMTGRTIEAADRLMLHALTINTRLRDGRVDVTTISELSRNLRSLTQGFPPLIDFALYDDNGQLIDTAANHLLPNRFSPVFWTSGPDRPGPEGPFFGPPVSDGNRLLLPIARPLRNDDGSLGAMVVMAIDTASFTEMLRSSGLAPGRRASLLDRDGRVLARTPWERLAPDSYQPLPTQLSAPDAPLAPMIIDRVTAEGDDDAGPSRMAYRRVSQLPLVVTVAVREDDLLGDWWRGQMVAAAITALVIILIILQAVTGSRQLRQEAAQQAALARARDAADQANRQKSHFLAVISHELRTPLAGIMDSFALLKGSPLSQGQNRLISALEASAGALLDVLNEVLDFSKIEAGRLVLSDESFDLRALLAGVEAIFTARIQAKGLGFSLTVAADVPNGLIGDPGRLRQILINLIGNAVKFTDQGRITVTVARTLDTPPQLSFTVEDSGIGISASRQSTLFEPFVQADPSVARRFGGTGLGLAICRRLVSALGGTITVSSRLGQGSRFQFTMALKSAALPPPSPRPHRPPAPERPQYRLLVAEDNDLNRFLIERHLDGRGYATVAVENGWRAVQAHRADDFDLLLLDMQMPVMDGPSAVREIRAMTGHKSRVPIVALTADALAEDIARYMDSGIDRLLTKPVDWDELDQTMRDLIENNGHGPPADRPSGEIIDRPVVENLYELLGSDGFAEVLVSFRQTLTAEGAKAATAIETQDSEGLRAAAHIIQGMAANLGAVALATTAKRLRFDGDNQAALREDLSRLKTTANATVAQLIATVEQASQPV